MVPSEIVAAFKRKLLSHYGYDESLKYVGPLRHRPFMAQNQVLLKPRDFFDFALRDSLEMDALRNRIACLSNCGRAIDCQVDCLINRLGFLSLARKERWIIPRKFDFISQLGILVPKALRRIITLRNLLEHEFIPPSVQEVQDALDFTQLFISYAELVQIPALHWTLSDKQTVRYDYERMVFHFFETDPRAMPNQEIPPLLSLAHDDEGFQEFYDFLMKTVPLMKEKGALGEDL